MTATQPVTQALPATAEHIPSLDGWRGLAIALVLFSHQSGSLGYGRDVMSIAGPIGNLGVRFFFVISGFLVTHLLLFEFEKTGRIDIVKFWRRRAFRLMPAALLFMACVYLAAALGHVQLQSPRDYLFPLTFTMNYYPGRGWYWVHLWSLSAQIQFYLVWPVLMLLAGKRHLLHLSLAAIVLIPLVRVAAFLFLPVWYTQGHSLETILDIFATGSLVAILRQPAGESKGYRHFLASPAIPALVILLLAMNSLSQFAKVKMLLITPMNLAVAILVDRSTRITGDWWGKLLASRPLVFLGAISYSVYIWQQPLVNVGTTIPFPLGLALALLAATASYYAIERPSTKLGR